LPFLEHTKKKGIKKSSKTTFNFCILTNSDIQNWLDYLIYQKKKEGSMCLG
jgi:hypothetical protein